MTRKGRKKMANELETRTGDVTEKVKRNGKRYFKDFEDFSKEIP